MNNNIFKSISLLILILASSNCRLFIKSNNKKISPNYGNYCKFDQVLTDFTAIPFDKTDLACKNFHKCINKTPLNPANCNKDLISKLEDNQKKSSIEIRNCQRIIEFFQ